MKQAAIGVVFVVAVLGIAAYSAQGDDGGEREAVSQCEAFADKRLKAPATADYDLAATQRGDGWEVVGTVDSENGFGAKVRSEVRCEVRFEGDTAYLDSIAVN